VYAGFSDWLDGFLAKRYHQESVLGSYLDPLADKAVVFFVVGALGWVGILSPPVVGVLIGRDLLLVLGSLIHRCVLGGFWHRRAALRWT
jgi:cardiolipin synthase (CMP-forming)